MLFVAGTGDGRLGHDFQAEHHLPHFQNAQMLHLPEATQWTSNARNAIGTANRGLLPSLGISLPLGGLAFVQTYWDQTYWDQTYWDQTYWSDHWDNDFAED